MISLPGLATGLARYDIGADILRTFAKFVDRGMLPNCFPDRGAAPEYNTADATLWLFHALNDYLTANRDPELTRELFPTLIAIIDAHVDGTRYGIRVDPEDGLLRAGEAGIQVTWMDAKQGDHVFTPRVGKPVEINALWMNALEVAARLADRGAQRRREAPLRGAPRARGGELRALLESRTLVPLRCDRRRRRLRDGCERAAQSDLRRVASLQRFAACEDARRGAVLRARARDQLRLAQLESRRIRPTSDGTRAINGGATPPTTRVPCGRGSSAPSLGLITASTAMPFWRSHFSHRSPST